MPDVLPEGPRLRGLPISDEVPQSKLDADGRSRTSAFPWRGQFSPEFAHAMLSAYATEGQTVLDPFCGSGTTLRECVRLGLGCIGVELNPAAWHMSKVFELSSVPRDERVDLMGAAEDVAAQFDAFHRTSGLASAVRDMEPSPVRDLLSLYVVLTDSNGNGVPTRDPDRVWHRIRMAVSLMPTSDAPVRAILGDARDLPIESGSVDLVLTSPPYVNVINYHQQYRTSVESLGYDVLTISKSELGSNRANRQNRFRTVVEWIVDMAEALGEMNRVSGGGSRIVLVVGRESSVLGRPVPDSEILLGVATDVLGLEPISRQSRSFRSRYGRWIVEDVLHLRASGRKDRLDVEGGARDFARGVLESMLDAEVGSGSPDPDVVSKLREVVGDVGSVRTAERG